MISHDLGVRPVSAWMQQCTVFRSYTREACDIKQRIHSIQCSPDGAISHRARLIFNSTKRYNVYDIYRAELGCFVAPASAYKDAIVFRVNKGR